MELISLLGISFMAVLAFFFAVWVLSLVLTDASIVDRFWGLGFILIAVLTAILGEGWIGRKILMTLPVMAWGLRLSLHLHFRNRGKGEDFRYQVFRQRSKQFWLTSLWNVFGLQAVLCWIIAWPLVWGMGTAGANRLTWTDTIGMAVWMAGFVMEAVADAQLRSFLRFPENHGKVMRTGLWACCRHPNYFGESLIWWGFFLMALSVPLGWLTLVSPAGITFLLVRISGVPMLENGLAERREGYHDYVRSTPAFIPRIPCRK